MVKKELRLTSRTQFQEVLNLGRWYRSPLFSIIVLAKSDFRVGVIVSRKVEKRAVGRNRIKRVIQQALVEIMRLRGQKDMGTKWIVFLVTKEMIGAKVERVKQEIERLIG